MDEFNSLRTLKLWIYKVLLKFGKSTVGDISRKAEIHRRNVYDCLNRLIKKGFVGYIQENNIKHYSITNPKNILKKLEEKKTDFENILPSLLENFNSNQSQRETLFFRGKEGLKQIFEDQIEVGKEILVNASSSQVSEILKWYFPQYDRKRKEKNIKVRMLFDKEYKRNKELKSIPLCKIKFIEEFNKSPTSQYIYGNNIAIIVWSQTPIAILIKQKEIADTFRNSFELLWKVGK